MRFSVLTYIVVRSYLNTDGVCDLLVNGLLVVNL